MDSVPRKETDTINFSSNDLETYMRYLALSDYWRKKADTHLDHLIRLEKVKLYGQPNTDGNSIQPG